MDIRVILLSDGRAIVGEYFDKADVIVMVNAASIEGWATLADLSNLCKYGPGKLPNIQLAPIAQAFIRVAAIDVMFQCEPGLWDQLIPKFSG